MEKSDLIDLDTYVALVKASPRVTTLPFEKAEMVVDGLKVFSLANQEHWDPDGRQYWAASLKEIHEAGQLGETAMISVGKICRMLGLTCWRVSDGYHVAFSAAQLQILIEKFDL